MKLTSRRTATVVVLVDPLVDDYQPIAPTQMTQGFDSYQPMGGVQRFVPHGPTFPAVSPQNVMIAQQDDATARAVLRQLQALIADDTEQPFRVQWDDYVPGPDDGLYWLFSAGGETESDFPGYIDPLQLSMAPADPSDAGPSALTLKVDGAAIGTLTAMRITLG